MLRLLKQTAKKKVPSMHPFSSLKMQECYVTRQPWSEMISLLLLLFLLENMSVLHCFLTSSRSMSTRDLMGKSVMKQSITKSVDRRFMSTNSDIIFDESTMKSLIDRVKENNVVDAGEWGALVPFIIDGKPYGLLQNLFAEKLGIEYNDVFVLHRGTTSTKKLTLQPDIDKVTP